MCMYPRHRSCDASPREEGQENENPPQFLFNMQLFLFPLRQSIMSEYKTYGVGLNASPPGAVQKMRYFPMQLVPTAFA